jgi:hypothetical protein
MTEDLFKTTLVMVESLQVFIVHSADIHHDIACLQRGRVSRSDQVCHKGINGIVRRDWLTWQTCIGIYRCLFEQVHCEGFIAMKGSIVRANDLKSG